MPKRTSPSSTQLASRVFMLMVGIAIALYLYFINLEAWETPTLITFAGYDITKYGIVLVIIFIGILAGAFIKYGLRGGRLKLS